MTMAEETMNNRYGNVHGWRDLGGGKVSLKESAVLTICERGHRRGGCVGINLYFDAPYDAQQALVFLARGRAEMPMEYILRTSSVERIEVDAVDDKAESEN